MGEIGSFPRISGLAAVSPHITTSATATLLALSELRELILYGPTITDDLLLALAGKSTLQELTLIHTCCTREGVLRFLDGVPACTVYRGGTDAILSASLRRALQLFVSGAFTRQS